MELPEKREAKSRKHPDWDPFRFFLLIAFPLAFILTIIFIFLKVKTVFYPNRAYRNHYFRLKDMLVCFSLLSLYLSFFLALFYVICFLVKMVREKPAHRKTAAKYLLILFSDWYLILPLAALEKSFSPLWACKFVLSGFFIHYFFSRPVMKLLHNQYPRHFPQFFNKHANIFGKVYTMSWPFAITIFNVNLQLIFLLLILCA